MGIGEWVIPTTTVVFLGTTLILTECLWNRRLPKAKKGPLSWRSWVMVIICLASAALGAFVGSLLRGLFWGAS